MWIFGSLLQLELNEVKSLFRANLRLIRLTCRHNDDYGSSGMVKTDVIQLAELDSLPVSDGFRLRGMDMTRLETFADAAFAFAVTLLVVGGGDAIPTSFEEMTQALKQVPAFAASFANIMLFWYAHHRWSRRFGLEDAGSAMLTMLLIFIVLIYVYPLKAIFSGAFQFFSGGYLQSYFGLRSIQDLRSLFIIFGSGYLCLSGVLLLLNRHALALADQLSLSELERYDTSTELRYWLISMSVPLLSIALAWLVADRFVVVAGMIYGIFGIVFPWFFSRRARVRARIAS